MMEGELIQTLAEPDEVRRSRAAPLSICSIEGASRAGSAPRPDASRTQVF
jgi:hypothetical protein